MYNDELYHYGVKGMRWGVRRARKQNQKIDKSFQDWKKNDKLKKDAITLGKSANSSRMAYESNKHDKNLKSQYRSDRSAYKKALRQNTTYRKGSIKQEVGKDASRQYLSKAKAIEKQLAKDPNNKQLKKQYNDMMNRHDVERANARRAQEVAKNRMYKKAAIKRSMTTGIKSAAASAALAGGALAINTALQKHNVTLNGNPIGVNSGQIGKAIKIGKDILSFGKYIY